MRIRREPSKIIRFFNIFFLRSRFSQKEFRLEQVDSFFSVLQGIFLHFFKQNWETKQAKKNLKRCQVFLKNWAIERDPSGFPVYSDVADSLQGSQFFLQIVMLFFTCSSNKTLLGWYLQCEFAKIRTNFSKTTKHLSKLSFALTTKLFSYFEIRAQLLVILKRENRIESATNPCASSITEQWAVRLEELLKKNCWKVQFDTN